MKYLAFVQTVQGLAIIPLNNDVELQACHQQFKHEKPRFYELKEIFPKDQTDPFAWQERLVEKALELNLDN